MSQFQYPTPFREDKYNKYNVEEPYQWLENPDSSETKNWVQDQNTLTQKFLQDYKHKDILKQKIKQLQNYEKYLPPSKNGEYYYFSKNSGLQNQYVIYRVKQLNDENPEVFMDPNQLAGDGSISLVSKQFSPDGKLWAYSESKNGSDWETIYIRDTLTKQNLQDKLEYVKFGQFGTMVWTKDSKGFFYNRYPQPKTGEQGGTLTESNQNGKIYYHIVGQKQEQDIIIYEDLLNPKLMAFAEISNDGKYLIVKVRKGAFMSHKLLIISLNNFGVNGIFEIKTLKIVDDFESMYSYISNQHSIFQFLTNSEGATRNKVIEIDLNNLYNQNDINYSDDQQRQSLLSRTIINELENKIVIYQAFAVYKNQILLIINKDVHNELHLYDRNTGKCIKEIPAPSIGTISLDGAQIGWALSSKPDPDSKELFYVFTSYLYPTSIYKYDYETEQLSVFKSPKIQSFDPQEFSLKQIFYLNKNDNTQIPMYIVSSQSNQAKQDNEVQPQPFHLYAYGGFSITIPPSFCPLRIALIKHLGISFAHASIRGGGEYGEEWHKQGMRENKQNVFDDFCYAAEYLIENKYTTTDKLVISGRSSSNGGLLIGACINQRPDLFKVAIPQVGALDMLQFHLFTLGYACIPEFGNPDDSEDFKFLKKYSPLHNVNKNEQFNQNQTQYPAVLLTTGDHDDRVVPLHSYKFLATLQHELGQKEYQKNPLMIRVDVGAGHGLGKPQEKLIDETIDIYAFMALNLNIQQFYQ